MMFPYVIAECRPVQEQEEYTDILIADEHYIFESVEPAEDIKAAILITIDIERIKPNHKAIVLHGQSIKALLDGLLGGAVS